MNRTLFTMIAVLAGNIAHAEIYIPLKLECTPKEISTITQVGIDQVIMSNRNGSFILSGKSFVTVVESGKTEKLPVQLAVGNIYTMVASMDEKPVFEDGAYKNSTMVIRERNDDTRITVIRNGATTAMECKKIEVVAETPTTTSTTTTAAATTSADSAPKTVEYTPGIVNSLKGRDFKAAVSTGTVAVKFKANWCGYCRAYKPTYASFAANRPDVAVYEIDVDQEPRLTQGLGVRGLPTTIIFKNGKVVFNEVGAQSMSTLDRYTQ